MRRAAVKKVYKLYKFPYEYFAIKYLTKSIKRVLIMNTSKNNVLKIKNKFSLFSSFKFILKGIIFSKSNCRIISGSRTNLIYGINICTYNQ